MRVVFAICNGKAERRLETIPRASAKTGTKPAVPQHYGPSATTRWWEGGREGEKESRQGGGRERKETENPLLEKKTKTPKEPTAQQLKGILE